MKRYIDQYDKIILTYTKGELSAIELTSKCDKIDYDGMKHLIPFYESDISKHKFTRI